MRITIIYDLFDYFHYQLHSIVMYVLIVCSLTIYMKLYIIPKKLKLSVSQQIPILKVKLKTVPKLRTTNMY